MRGSRQAWLVAMREVRERGRSRAFLAALIIMVLGVVGVIALPTLIDTSAGTKDIGFTGPTPAALTGAIAAQADAVGTKTRVERYDTRSAGEQAVREGKIDVLIVDARTLEWPKRADEQLKALTTAAIQISTVQERAATQGISDAQLGALLVPVAVSNVELGRVAGRSPDDETAAFIMTVLLFMTIATYGAMVLNGVVEEKASRVVEVLLARIPARSLLAGKIAGIGLLGLGQVAVTAVAALIAAATISGVDLPAVRGGVLAWAVAWFILGYALYATVFGALGSLASRPEDAQTVAGPVSVVLVLVYFVSFAASGSPDAVWARVVSWIPLTAPIAMPTRIAMGVAEWWEPLAAAALTAAAVAALVVVGGRIYTNAALHSGPTLKLRDAWVHRAETAESSSVDADTDTPDGPPESAMIAPASVGRTKSVAFALTVAVAIGGVVTLLTADVVIGIGVSAATFAVVDRLARSRGASVAGQRKTGRGGRGGGRGMQLRG